MPIIQSAKKRVRVSAKAAIRNAKTKRNIREALKAFQAAVATGKADKINEAKNKVVSAIDTAVKKNVLHKNKAARKKSQISLAAKTAGAKPVTAVKKPNTKKITAKSKSTKLTAKKSSAKKQVSKKIVTKKPATKKATK